MDADYARAYRTLYEQHWWWRARERLLLQTIRGIAGSTGSTRILDIGCGSGLFFDRLSEFGHVEGVEMDPQLATAEPRFRDRIHIGDLRSVQPAGRFDLILMLDVLEHIPEPEPVFRRALSLLEPGGRILITVPAFPALWTHHDVINEHVMRYTRATLRALVEAAGARIERSHYFFGWTVPVKLLVRGLERLRGPSGRAEVPPGPINRLLLRLSTVEQALFSRVKPPVGSSLLAVCAKNGAAG